MAAKVQISDNVKIAPPPRATKIKTHHNQGGDELLKEVLTKRAKKVSTMESTTSTSTESKKTCISTQNLQPQEKGEPFKVPTKTKTDEKANISESKSKRKEAPKHMCTCSPTTHEGSFRCRLHRIGTADKNSNSEKKIKLTSCHSHRRSHMVEFKPHLSRFGRVASEPAAITHDGLSQSANHQ